MSSVSTFAALSGPQWDRTVSQVVPPPLLSHPCDNPARGCTREDEGVEKKKRGGVCGEMAEESKNLLTTARKHGSEPTPLNHGPNNAQLHATPPAAKLWSTALPFTRRGPASSPGGRGGQPFPIGVKDEHVS